MRRPNFSTLYTGDQDELEHALARDDTRAAVQRLRDHLDALPDRQRRERERAGVPLPAEAARQSQELVEAVRIGLGALDAVRARLAGPAPTAHAEPPRGLVATLLRLFRGGDAAPSPAAAPADPEIELDARRLVHTVGHALEAAARAVDDGEPEPEAVDPWTADPTLPDLLQDLLSARLRGNADEVFLRLEALESDLRMRHDIRAVPFDGHNEALFEFWPSPDPADERFVTRRPALVTSAGVLRRGEVSGPGG